MLCREKEEPKKVEVLTEPAFVGQVEELPSPVVHDMKSVPVKREPDMQMSSFDAMLKEREPEPFRVATQATPVVLQSSTQAPVQNTLTITGTPRVLFLLMQHI